MSDENTHAVPDDGQEPEQRRNIEPKAAENSANPEIAPAESHKRKRDYLPFQKSEEVLNVQTVIACRLIGFSITQAEPIMISQSVNPMFSKLIFGMRGFHTPLRAVLSRFFLCGTVFVPFDPVSSLDCSSVSIELLVSGTFHFPFPTGYGNWLINRVPRSVQVCLLNRLFEQAMILFKQFVAMLLMS